MAQLNTNKLKTELKRSNRNNSKCTVFIMESKFDKMITEYKYSITQRKKNGTELSEEGKKKFIKGGPITVYLKISNDKYIPDYFFFLRYPNYFFSAEKGITNLDDICLVENYTFNNYIESNNSINKYNDLCKSKKSINETLQKAQNNLTTYLTNPSSNTNLDRLLNIFSVFIEKYKIFLPGELETITTNNNQTNNSNLTKNNFLQKYSTQLVQLCKDFSSATLFDYVKLQETLVKLSKLIAKYNSI
jgi:hypothetical protein